jgi:hypothetical protein
MRAGTRAGVVYAGEHVFFIRGAREEKWSAWIGYAVALALGMYVHLTMGFIAVGHAAVYMWMLAERTRALGRLPKNAWAPVAGFVLAGMLTAAMYAPVMGDMIHRTVGAEAKTSPTLGGLVVLAGLWSFWRENRYATGLIIFPGVVTAAAMLALSRNLWPRFFFFAIGLGMMLIVRGAMEWAGAAARMCKRDAATGARWGTPVVAVLLLSSCVQLRAAYLYPKQDYLGAMHYVDAEQKPGDTVALVGLTTIPYRNYYDRDWPSVQTPAQLAALHQPGQATWVLYTIPIYVESRYPELWNTLRSECAQPKVFRGSMGGGEFYVCRVESKGNRD